LSVAGIIDNDENVAAIRGEKRVSDIYFGVFMRLFLHHRFRESLKRLLDEIAGSPATEFQPGSEHEIKRLYFAGSIAS
jgi:hypothetical protein